MKRGIVHAGARCTHDYADETVSTKVVKVIQSYTGIVDRVVWRKQG